MAAEVRRSALASWSSTIASMACSVLVTVSAPHRRTRAANSSSTAASASESSTSWVRQTIARTNKSVISPAANNSATCGSRSRNATPRCAWASASPRLVPSAAPSSTLTAPSGSIHQSCRSCALSRPVRRQNNSATAANLRALAADSARDHPLIASTRTASSTAAKSSISGSKPSNIHASLESARRRKPPAQALPVDEITSVDNSAARPLPTGPEGWSGRRPAPRNRHSRRRCRGPSPRCGRARRGR